MSQHTRTQTKRTNYRQVSNKRRKLEYDDLNCKLRMAIRYGTSLQQVVRLVSEGASVNNSDDLGYTPLLLAIQYSKMPLDFIQLLCSLGADVTEQKDVFHGHSPLHFAAARDLYEVIKILVRYGADLNARTFSGQTPLHITSFYGYEASTRVLCKLGACVKVKENYSGYTPLHVAMTTKNNDVIDLLVQFGASPGEKDNYGMSAYKRCRCTELEARLSEFVKNPKTLEYLCLRVVRNKVYPPKLKAKLKNCLYQKQ